MIHFRYQRHDAMQPIAPRNVLKASKINITTEASKVKLPDKFKYSRVNILKRMFEMPFHCLNFPAIAKQKSLAILRTLIRQCLSQTNNNIRLIASKQMYLKALAWNIAH